MTKAKSNALEALRALIAERQQYEQWISVLESKREGTPPHVFEKVQSDYNTRLQRVVTDIKGHAEELQLSISALSSRLVEVAREEDTRRDALEEAQLRATVGEFEPQQWEQLRGDAERGLEKVAADRASLDAQLGELRSIQKLSEVGSVGDVETVVRPPLSPADRSTARDMMASSTAAAAAPSTDAPTSHQESVASASPPSAVTSAPAATETPISDRRPEATGNVENSADMTLPNVTANDVVAPSRQQGRLPFDRPAGAQKSPVVPAAAEIPVNVAAAPTPSSAPSGSASAPQGGQKSRSGKTPPFGSTAANKPKQQEPRVDQTKTLKCPECGTPNYATEWYCERCGGELATM